ncbi:hypothetical protein SAMN05443667_101270 [Flavobacterium gillisiae]|uniref:Uncharacterized protein n=1 Tax=Flavobacterium gillisiae TaxID=150146 RepID=A0A1H3WYS7_9FLAO|nr:hypothetical protein [Flavobacterium gillisiae]SDZ91388.1 hypothetical protein SAMN05443667_101270 [Flavobacterium gillisiae]
MHLNSEIQKAVDKVVSEKVPEMVEKHIETMINSVVKDIFCSYGDTSKELKKRIEETLKVNLQEFDLIDYNALVAKTINDNLLQQVNLQPILELTQNIVGFVNKKEIRLQEIADMFIEASQEKNDQSGEGNITFIVNENREHNWVEIYADIDPDIEEYKCAIKFIFSTKGDRKGGIFTFKTKDDHWDSTQKPVSPSRLVSMRNIEAKIFRLYSAQVKITDFDYTPSNYWDRY